MIRCGVAGDLDALALISSEREGVSIQASRRSFERLLEDERLAGAGDAATGTHLLVAEFSGSVAGFGKVARFDPPLHAAPNVAPAGWYLTGLIVAPALRRHGIGEALTRARLDWIATRSPAAWYFANAQNEVTIALHRKHGFVEFTRSFHYPGVNFRGGAGILFRADLGDRPAFSG